MACDETSVNDHCRIMGTDGLWLGYDSLIVGADWLPVGIECLSVESRLPERGRG